MKQWLYEHNTSLWKLRGNSRENCIKAKGGYWGWVYFDKMVLKAVRQGGGWVTSGQRRLKGDYQVGVHLDKMVLMVVRRACWTPLTVAKDTQRNSRGTIRLAFTYFSRFLRWPDREAGPHERWPKALKEKAQSDFRQPRDLPNGQRDSPTERDNLLFFWGIMKSWDCCRWWWWDEPLWNNKSVWQQHCVPKDLLLELRIHSQIWPPNRKGTGNRQSTRQYRQSWLDARFRPDLHTMIKQIRASNYFVTGEDK